MTCRSPTCSCEPHCDEEIAIKAKSPKSIALRFNDCITRHDLASLAKLTTDDHVFIDRDGNVTRGKEKMVKAWEKFFKIYPKYKNIFNAVKARNGLVILRGYAYWSDDNKHDPAIWTARITDGLVTEWRIHHDTSENREKLGI